MGIVIFWKQNYVCCKNDGELSTKYLHRYQFIVDTFPHTSTLLLPSISVMECRQPLEMAIECQAYRYRYHQTWPRRAGLLRTQVQPLSKQLYCRVHALKVLLLPAQRNQLCGGRITPVQGCDRDALPPSIYTTGLKLFFVRHRSQFVLPIQGH